MSTGSDEKCAFFVLTSVHFSVALAELEVRAPPASVPGAGVKGVYHCVQLLDFF